MLPRNHFGDHDVREAGSSPARSFASNCTEPDEELIFATICSLVAWLWLFFRIVFERVHFKEIVVQVEDDMAISAGMAGLRAEPAPEDLR